jgi:hypothetical protein
VSARSHAVIRARRVVAGLVALGWGVTVRAESPGTLHHSFDVTVQRGGGAGPTFDDEAAIAETTAPAWTATALGSLPAAADLTALHQASDGRWYFALDTFVDLGAVEAGPEDVLGWNGSAHALVFDGSAEGIPAGAAIDAIAQAPGMGLLLSFDIAVPIGAEVADDADLVAWDGSNLTIVFDASDYGIPDALDLDALDVDATDDSLYLSFDGSGRLGGVDFDDHDLLHFDLATWTKVDYPGLTQPGTGAADLDATDYVTPGIFADGFETSDESRWSAAVG